VSAIVFGRCLGFGAKVYALSQRIFIFVEVRETYPSRQI
jgi:hypothetical protein